MPTLSPVKTNPFRSLFPATQSKTAFLDNAGGSQLPGVVIDAMSKYLKENFAQTGAEYVESKRAGATVKRAHDYLKMFMGAYASTNAQSPIPNASLGEVIIGPSTSQLCRMLADCYADILSPGDEVVLCETAHESNFGPWARLAKFGIKVNTWKISGATMFGEQVESAQSPQRIAALKSLLSNRTRIVAFPQVSNILGEVVDAAAITRIVREQAPKARVVVDGVACAPHRAIDVAAIDADWYVYSTYKVFGPHAAAMFGKMDAMAELTGPNHYFISKSEVPRKFELGGTNHESCAGIAALEDYLSQAVRAWGGVPHPPEPRAIVERAFHAFEVVENDLQKHFMEWLTKQPAFRVIGPTAADSSRVCTISFVSTRGRPSKSIVQSCNEQGVGVKHGNFYAYRLCEAVGLDPNDGVIRASFAHYNTHEEVDRLIAALNDAT
ncbi:MAG: aminotransferase class V-fold PLP-dependent enzyme [Phycisphaerales bacterium]